MALPDRAAGVVDAPASRFYYLNSLQIWLKQLQGLSEIR
jgi:hypothetical protein